MIYLENVSYTYPFQSKEALSSVSFEVKPGEAVLFTGKSGCGKSTLVRVINGLAPHYYKGRLEGKVSVNGSDSLSRGIHDIAKDVGTLFQDPENQFFALNVEDEMAFAHECRGVSSESIRRIISKMVERFSLEKVIHSKIFDLSEGEKQKVALASVISLKPGVILLDEPSANLDPCATKELAYLLDGLKKEGFAIVIVDHRLYWMSGLVDRVYILEHGKIVESGDFSILDGEKVWKKYGLRKTGIDPLKKELSKTDRSLAGGYKVDGMTFAYNGNCQTLFDNVTLKLPFGEVIAVVGDNGTGKTTFAKLITGLLKMFAGHIFLNNRIIPRKKLLEKTGIVLQNADHQLYMKTVEEELIIAAGHLAKGVRKEKAGNIMDFFDLRELAGRHPQSLSGGQKQRLVIACGLIKEPDILILDEPTSGLDGVNMKIISDMMKSLAAQGKCVLVISHDLELINMACGYRICFPLS